ncbi:MAG TPA: hypothetical protein VGR64_02810 [Terracidiphilus sp.]|nr:hypothetical protein [Terracidiphilus sp.]
MEKDLPGFVQQALQNIRQTMILSDEVHGSYMLGTHPMQIERASGVVIGAPDIRYTVEITCSVLHRGAVCWMGMAAALPDLTTFEQGRVSLDGEPAAFLVPPNVFRKNAPTSAPNR